jgi:hypothetical protein
VATQGRASDEGDVGESEDETENDEGDNDMAEKPAHA